MNSQMAWWLGAASEDAREGLRHWRLLWSTDGERWLLVAALATVLFGAAIWLAWRSRRQRPLLALTLLGLRCAALLLLIGLWLQPTLQATSRRKIPPRVLVVLDGTQSMLLADRYAADPLAWLEAAQDATESPTVASRTDLIRKWLTHPKSPLRKLEQQGVIFEWATFDSAPSSRLRWLREQRENSASKVALQDVAALWRPDGEVTSLGGVLQDLTGWPAAEDAAAVLIVSDFAQNSGPAPTALRERFKAFRAPLLTIGVGPTSIADLQVRLEAGAKWKREQPSRVTVVINQQQLGGGETLVRLWARPLQARASGDSHAASARRELIEERRLTLEAASQEILFDYTPRVAGPLQLEVEVQPLAGEANLANNEARREVKVVDDYLRLLYIAHDPNWEWRFIKEAFHRDPLVGVNGFRTFLASSDPRVRQTNPLFLDTAELPRKTLLEQDVIFLGDMPPQGVSPRTGEMIHEFVSRHGGGLVVIGGPRFGPGALLDTPLAQMLPVVPFRQAPVRDDRPFAIRKTRDAQRFGFMQLADNPAADQAAWSRLDGLPWFRPVRSLHEQAVSLAEHPSVPCDDQTTPQPLIAIRSFGNGEVVYVGVDEMWRLRRGVGEADYRRFWSQLIYRLGMSHALGADKRFQMQWSAQQIAVGQPVLATVECYDENFEPLPRSFLEEGGLAVRVSGPTTIAEHHAVWVRPGVFQFEFIPEEAGRHEAEAIDPITGNAQRSVIEVQALQAESSDVRRDVDMQRLIAAMGSGRALELHETIDLPKLSWPQQQQTTIHENPLWRTPLWFLLFTATLIAEWTLRVRNS